MINLYYDNIVEQGPVPNGTTTWDITTTEPFTPYVSDEYFFNTAMIHRVCMFYHTMVAQGCKVNLLTNKNTANAFYPIELSFHNRINVCDMIPEKTLNRLKKGKLKPLLLYQEEGADIHTMQDVRRVADQIAQQGVDPALIHIVLGDLNCVYKEFFDPYKIYGIDWWQVKHQLTAKTRQGIADYGYTSMRGYDRYVEESVLDLDKPFEYKKTFLCFNGNNRIHRAGIVSEFIVRGLKDDGYISYNIYDNPSSFFHFNDERIVKRTKDAVYKEHKQRAIDYINNNQLLLDHGTNEFFNDDRQFDANLYYKSAISVVTETYAGLDSEEYPAEAHVLWTTEKTWKPISLGHPFIVLGSVNTIKYLREEGYYTFNDVVNTSYDAVVDLPDRIERICDELEKLSALPKAELAKKFELQKHLMLRNRRTFYNKNHADKFYALFRELNNG